MKPSLTSLGIAIDDYIQERDISLTDFARLIQVDHSTVTSWRLGTRKPSLDVIRRIRDTEGAEKIQVEAVKAIDLFPIAFAVDSFMRDDWVPSNAKEQVARDIAGILAGAYLKMIDVVDSYAAKQASPIGT